MNSAFLRRVNRPQQTKPIIIWDLDGTVIDESLYKECTQTVFKNLFGVTTTDEEYEMYFAEQSYDAELTISFLLSKGARIANLSTLKHVFDLIDEEFINFIKLGRVEVIATSLKLMQAFNALGHTQCLVTGTNREIVNEVLATLIPNYFAHIITREDTFWQKPHPHPYELCVFKLGVEAGDCIVIENSKEGLISASCAGLKTWVIDHASPDKVLQRSL